MPPKKMLSSAINLLAQLTKTKDTFDSLDKRDVEGKVEKPINYSSKDISRLASFSGNMM